MRNSHRYLLWITATTMRLLVLCVILINIHSYVLPDGPMIGAGPTPDTIYNSDMKFTHYWFDNHVHNWLTFVIPRMQKLHARSIPIRALEIGCYEGRATIWIYKHITQFNEHSNVVCVDSFEDSQSVYEAGLFSPDVKDRWTHNINAVGSEWGIMMMRHRSQIALRILLGYHTVLFDLIYIDGSHKRDDVASDADSLQVLHKEYQVFIVKTRQWSIQDDL